MERDSNRQQFSIKSLFWFMIAISLLLSYAKGLGGNALPQVMIFAIFGSLIGGCLGWLLGNWQDGLFWSLLTTMLVYLAVAGGRLPTEAVYYGWGLVGSICGALCAFSIPKKIWLGSMFMAFVGSLTMISSLVFFRCPIDELILFDVVSAFVVGSILRPFIQFLRWFESRSHQPRVVLASWLAISILIGNFLVPIVGGVTR